MNQAGMWIGGLISAASGGVGGMLGGAIADPKDFNFSDAAGFHKMLIAAMFSAIVPVLAFLKQRPLPGIQINGNGDH